MELDLTNNSNESELILTTNININSKGLGSPNFRVVFGVILVGGGGKGVGWHVWYGGG